MQALMTAPIAGDEVVDPLEEAIVFSEQLGKAEAYKQVDEIRDSTTECDFRLGGVLSAIKKNKWYKDEGFDGFPEFVESRFGIHRRKASYLVKLYTDIAQSGVDWEKVKGIGWTKLKEIAPVLTEDNVESWVAFAMQNTTINIREHIKKIDNPAVLVNPGEKPASNTSTLTFKVHDDQKSIIVEAIGVAQSQLGTDAKAVALDAICQNFLSGGATPDVAEAPANPPPVPLKDQLLAMGVEDAIDLVDACFPEIELTVGMPDD